MGGGGFDWEKANKREISHNNTLRAIRKDYGPPTQKFWAAWRKDKLKMQAMGWRVYRLDNGKGPWHVVKFI